MPMAFVSNELCQPCTKDATYKADQAGGHQLTSTHTDGHYVRTNVCYITRVILCCFHTVNTIRVDAFELSLSEAEKSTELAIDNCKCDHGGHQ